MSGEKFLVDARLVMKTVEMRLGNELHQVSISRLILGQQREVIGRIAHRCRPICDRTGRHVSFATNDRLDAGARRFLVKFDRAEEISVIGDGDRRHLEFLRFFHQLLHPHRTIQERILGVQVEMNEGITGHRTHYKLGQRNNVKFTRERDSSSREPLRRAKAMRVFFPEKS